MIDDDDLQRLAGEYVLGTLDAAERRCVQARLAEDAALRSAVEAWEQRLLPLTSLAEPVMPPDAVWARIEHSVGTATLPAPSPAPSPAPASAAAASAASRGPAAAPTRPPTGWWHSLPLWRGLGLAGSLATLVLAATLVLQRAAPPASPQYLVVLVSPQAREPGWVIQARDDRHVELIPLAVVPVSPDRALQFWTKADDWQAPVSLGLVQPGQTLRVPLDALPPLQPNQLFELTLEPATGSPTGRPTGPIQAIGRAVKVL